MVLTVKPAVFLKGGVSLPASKSYSIRAFMIAACGGRSTIVDPSRCDDAKASAKVAAALGAKVRRKSKGLHEQWEVLADQRQSPSPTIHVHESGTVLRFLLPLLAFRGGKSTVIGEGTLRGRPNAPLLQTLRAKGVRIHGQGKNESVPIVLDGGSLRGGKIFINGSLSSQFVSALMIAAPQLPEETHLILRGKKLVSADYIAMTRTILQKSGIRIDQKNSRTYRIKGRQKFRGLKNFTVPSDYGLAAFLMAAAALTPSQITLTGNLDDRLIQADGHIMEFLAQMGVPIRTTSTSIKIKGPCVLAGRTFSLKNCPDLVPIMAILALFAKGKTRLCHIAHVRAKESDRISDLRHELLKVGAKIIEKADEMVIIPQKEYKRNCLLDPHKDHRLAMAFCVLGLKLGARVKDIECTHKSYPDFVRDFKRIGALVSKAS